MAWCRQATSHYLSQCWHRSMSPYGITRPQWLKQLQNKSIYLPVHHQGHHRKVSTKSSPCVPAGTKSSATDTALCRSPSRRVCICRTPLDCYTWILPRQLSDGENKEFMVIGWSQKIYWNKIFFKLHSYYNELYSWMSNWQNCINDWASHEYFKLENDLTHKKQWSHLIFQ